eukprot:TRINITY_DN6434_c0_g1_i3.p1 TRINITY_DN6434_c0_g1~~TRINITY_DN6434_c0_g1_i3.p1  ORF type:complete len:224 (-),score=44.44 TRINITY_DN6434_c0_g1_i3:78-719(-)
MDANQSSPMRAYLATVVVDESALEEMSDALSALFTVDSLKNYDKDALGRVSDLIKEQVRVNPQCMSLWLEAAKSKAIRDEGSSDVRGPDFCAKRSCTGLGTPQVTPMDESLTASSYAAGRLDCAELWDMEVLEAKVSCEVVEIDDVFVKERHLLADLRYLRVLLLGREHMHTEVEKLWTMKLQRKEGHLDLEKPYHPIVLALFQVINIASIVG